VQYAKQTKHNIFQYLQSIPSLFQDFNLFMGNTMGARDYWHDWYNVESRLIRGFDLSNGPALLVDIGGGKGHDLIAFDNSFGRSYEGKLVLQDQPQVLEAIPPGELSERITKVAYDFFEAQPEKGLPNTPFQGVL
jgi:hypothetical protein